MIKKINLDKKSINLPDNLKLSFANEENKKFKDDDYNYYINKWYGNLFLHSNKNDIDLTLAETFIMPDYSFDGIRYKDLNKKLDEFILWGINNILVIRGTPGIGKSSLVSYIAYKYQEVIDILFIRYDKKESEIIDLISNLEKVILIVDSPMDIKKYLELSKIYPIRVLMLTRESVDEENIITLEPFSREQINLYYNRILKIDPLPSVNIELLGNPLLLYIFISYGIENLNIDNLYDNVFGLYAGIYNREISQTSFIKTHDIEKIKKDFYLIYCRIAYNMFNENRNWLEQKEFFSIVKNICVSDNFLDNTNILIFNDKRIEFIHKTIYEYYVASFIYDNINEPILQGNKEKVANILGEIFSQNILSKEILNFLRLKISSNKIKNFFRNTLDTFEIVLQNGMSYYSNKPFLCAIKCEINIFCNMLEFIHLWESENIEIKNKQEFIFYIKHASLSRIILNLSKINLNNVDLSECNLSNADLSYADLSGSELSGCKMVKADLYRANLRQTNLVGVNFTQANLEQTYMKGANITNAEFQYAYLHYTELETCNFANSNFLGANVKGIGAIKTDSRVKNLFKKEGEKPKVFISYTQEDKSTADKLDVIITKEGCIINKDTQNLKYWSSIREYMRSIADNDYIVVIISDKYLKSPNCMYEMLELMKLKGFERHILPIVLDNNIYVLENQIAYINYWENKCKGLKERLMQIQIENLASMPVELKKYQDIASSIGKFLKIITDIKNPSYNEVISALHELLYY